MLLFEEWLAFFLLGPVSCICYERHGHRCLLQNITYYVGLVTMEADERSVAIAVGVLVVA